MNTHRCLKIADRMNALLQRELGQGVDGLRMVAEPLYARDVLLVCDAMPGAELATLAQQFRVAATEKWRDEAGPPQPAARGSDALPAGKGPASKGATHAGTDTDARTSSGFGASVWSRLASGFGFGPSTLDSQPAASGSGDGRPPTRRWFSLARGRAGSDDRAEDAGRGDK